MADLYYIGSNDCKVASCNRRQEFPEAEDPYCVEHSLENWLAGSTHEEDDSS